MPIFFVLFAILPFSGCRSSLPRVGEGLAQDTRDETPFRLDLTILKGKSDLADLQEVATKSSWDGRQWVIHTGIETETLRPDELLYLAWPSESDGPKNRHKWTLASFWHRILRSDGVELKQSKTLPAVYQSEQQRWLIAVPDLLSQFSGYSQDIHSEDRQVTTLLLHTKDGPYPSIEVTFRLFVPHPAIWIGSQPPDLFSSEGYEVSKIKVISRCLRKHRMRSYRPTGSLLIQSTVQESFYRGREHQFPEGPLSRCYSSEAKAEMVSLKVERKHSSEKHFFEINQGDGDVAEWDFSPGEEVILHWFAGNKQIPCNLPGTTYEEFQWRQPFHSSFPDGEGFFSLTESRPKSWDLDQISVTGELEWREPSLFKEEKEEIFLKQGKLPFGCQPFSCQGLFK